ncbi:MAG: epoxide hydrolase [Acidobacteria bacterium]|nr:epoxide hydrolase [Acidobacteriota bacterium]MCB9399316.1 epoxide hydrolase [Acidobacteriota bacterium]
MKPFSIQIPDAELAELKLRLHKTRWPVGPPASDWWYGVPQPFIEEIHRAWKVDFDWRKQEKYLNTFPQFICQIEGLEIHFVYQKSSRPNAIPLLICHGWPSSFVELLELVEPLTNPGPGQPAYDVVIPSVPGFGFSTYPEEKGWVAVENYFQKLMIQLGFPRFLMHGTDVGARITSAMALHHPDSLLGIHIASVDLEWPNPLPTDLTQEELNYLDRIAHWEKSKGAYAEIQATTPQTIAYALNDSPVGLAAWIAEKFYFWRDQTLPFLECFPMDKLLTNIQLYWVTQTINSSMRRYFEGRHRAFSPVAADQPITTPTAISMFPGEGDLLVPRTFVERMYNLVQWTEPETGGHFPALENPQKLLADLYQFTQLLKL